jgi:hypothetical protein
MEVVAKGMEPVWDKENKKFVSKDELESKPGGDLESEIKMMSSSKKVASPKKSVPIPTVDDEEDETQINDSDESGEDDELPF